MRKLLSIMMAIAPLYALSQQISKSLTASDGSFVGFLEYKPVDYRKSGPKYPLIIFLHGTGERGNGKSELNRLKSFAIPKMIDRGNKMSFTVNGKTETFLVLSPQLPRSKSSWTPIYVEALINYAIKNLNVDQDRIHLTGLSMGGGGVWRYASSSPANASKLASIAPICGTCSMSNAKTIADAGLPVWAFHAQNDNVVGVSCSINAINNINKSNPKTKAQFTLYSNGGHGIWDRAYDTRATYQQQNLFEWFLLQNRRNGGNRLPIAMAGSSATINNNPGTITLKGSASDPDGSVTRLAWKKTGGPAGGSISNPSIATPTITGLRNIGTYKYELTAIDNRGGWSVSTVSIKVVKNDENIKAPQAKAGADQSITLPENKVVLDGSSSSAETGTIKSYQWTKTSGSHVSISNGNRAVTTISGFTMGTYRFRLTVKDENGRSATDEVSVIVNKAVENQKPIAHAGSQQTIILPKNTVVLDGSKSSDPDGAVRVFKWTKLSGPSAKIVNPNGPSTQIVNMVKGSYIFQLKVEDNKGAFATQSVSVKVEEPEPVSNRLPVAVTDESVSIREPANTVNLEGDRSHDPDGNIVSYSWSLISGSTAAWIENKTNKNTRIRALKEGKYVVRLTVKDNKNASASIDKTIVVSNRNGSGENDRKSNAKPVADAGSSQQLSYPVDAILLDGSASSDPDGRIISYQWKKISGPSLTIRNAGKAIANIPKPPAGMYVFELSVVDDKEATAASRVTIMVSKKTGNGNRPPIADAGSTANIREPANTVNLVGDQSRDLDGNIVRYHWKIVSGNQGAWIENSSSRNTRIRSLKAGRYLVRLEVQDNDQAISTADKTIIVSPNHSGNSGNNNETNLTEIEIDPNKPNPVPVSDLRADAGNDIIIAEPANSATLFGQNSQSTGASIVRYEWKKISGSSAAWIENPQHQTARIRSLKAGKYVLRLTVTDSKNRTDSDDLVITVNQRRSESVKSGIDGELTQSNEQPKTIKLFPNPAINQINIIMNDDKTGNGVIRVFDVSGKMVQSRTFVKKQMFHQEKMELQQLRPGIYVLEIRIGKNTRDLIRFIKQ